MEVGLDYGSPGLGPHPRLEELEVGPVSHRSVVAPVTTAFSLANVKTAKKRKQQLGKQYFRAN